MASWEPEEQVRIPAARQSWHEMTFVHHGYRPDDVSALLPNAYKPDTDSSAIGGAGSILMELL